MTIAQIRATNRQRMSYPCVGDMKHGHVVVWIGAGHVMAVPKDRAVKFTLQEWSEMSGKGELK